MWPIWFLYGRTDLCTAVHMLHKNTQQHPWVGASPPSLIHWCLKIQLDRFCSWTQTLDLDLCQRDIPNMLTVHPLFVYTKESCHSLGCCENTGYLQIHQYSVWCQEELGWPDCLLRTLWPKTQIQHFTFIQIYEEPLLTYRMKTSSIALSKTEICFTCYDHSQTD